MDQKSPCSLSQDDAMQLFIHGATLVFLDVPKGTEFGIDYNVWSVGPNFKGVKMIPPGIHFVYYSAVGKDGQPAPRSGFFHNFKEREVIIKRYNKETEDINTSPISPEEQERIEGNKVELDRFLGAYPYEQYEKWVSLTSYLTPDLLAKLVPTSGCICSVSQFESESSNSQSRKEAKDAKARHVSMETSSDSHCDEGASSEKIDDISIADVDADGLPNMKQMPGTEINFCKIPEKKYPDGANASEVSQCSMDHSYVLSVVMRHYEGNVLSVLGELQFAFLCFLMGQVYEGFEQWKALVNLLCNCEKALAEHPELYVKFIGMMHYHIKEIPEDFFVDIVGQNNFLVANLRSFFENVKESGVGDELKQRAGRFQSHLEKKFKWDLSTDDWDEDNAPVVIDL